MLCRTRSKNFDDASSRELRRKELHQKDNGRRDSIIMKRSYSREDHQGRIRFCALILDFDEKRIFHVKFTINLYKILYYWLKINKSFRKMQFF